MADLSSFTGRFRAQRDNSSNSSAARVTKRHRESLVCNPCRRSKLRCDRGQPCSSCLKRDEAATCSYQQTTGSKLDPSRHVAVEDRLSHLESMVKHIMQNHEVVQSGGDVIPANQAPQPELLGSAVEVCDEPLSKQVGNPKYVGFTHWSAILDDIHELKIVLGDSAHVQEEQSITSEDSILDGELIFGSANNYSIHQIISEYLPPKVEVDRFLSMYFQGETFIVPIVHTHQFQSQYREFWANTVKVNPLWLSMLLSICSMAAMIGEADPAIPSSEISLTIQRSILHTAAGKCLVLGKYHQPQRYTVEALVMYAQCKNLKTLDPSREAGTILGMAIRMAYEMGYHRDPDLYGTFTTFDGEMRRRVWAVCKQMDLMISFQLGLPSNICLEECDTKSPRNLLDLEFNENTQELPASRSENEATRLIWFIVKDRLMKSFSKVCQDALSFREKSEAEILELDAEIRQMYMTIPDVLKARTLSESIADAPFLIMVRLFVDFIYLKSLCVLHRRYMARGNIFSTISCLEAGRQLVTKFIDMYEEFPPGGQLHSVRWMLSNFTMNDFLLGVMVLCLAVHSHRKRGSENTTIASEMESEVLLLLEKSHVICVEKSTASRDARRVSHAVYLTLNGIKAVSTPENTGHQFPLMSPANELGMNSSFGDEQAVDPASLLLHPRLGHTQGGDETAFGLLDPFNFLGNDMENFDWTIFDNQISG